MFLEIMIAVLLVIIGIAVFTGATWAHEFLDRIRYNAELQRHTFKAYKTAADVSAFNTLAGAVKYR